MGAIGDMYQQALRNQQNAPVVQPPAQGTASAKSLPWDFSTPGAAPDFQDWINAIYQNAGNYTKRYPQGTASTGFGVGNAGIGRTWASSAETLANLGYANLGEILGRRGATDPRLFNRNIADISRTGQRAQDDARSELARMGPGGMQSGVGQALLAAIGQGTQGRIAGARAQEAALTEERRRGDIALMLDAVINPGIQTYGIQKGVSVAQQQQQAQERGAMIAAFARLFGAAV